MQWFFTICQETLPLYIELAKMAVHTSKKFTSLEPHLLYNGASTDPRLTWFKRNGVIVHCYKSEWEEFTEQIWKHKCLLGSMIKIDIPLFTEDDYVLYADSDVIFNGDVSDLNYLKPKYIAASPEFQPKDFSYFNAGVMLLNVNNLRTTHDLLARYIRKNASGNWAVEQTPLNHLYPNDWLDSIYNWKAYWNFDERARIIHFHALKPYGFHSIGWDHLISPGFKKSICLYESHEQEMVPSRLEKLYLERNTDVQKAVQAGTIPSGYQHYCKFGIHESRIFWDYTVI